MRRLRGGRLAAPSRPLTAADGAPWGVDAARLTQAPLWGPGPASGPLKGSSGALDPMRTHHLHPAGDSRCLQDRDPKSSQAGLQRGCSLLSPRHCSQRPMSPTHTPSKPLDTQQHPLTLHSEAHAPPHPSGHTVPPHTAVRDPCPPPRPPLFTQPPTWKDLPPCMPFSTAVPLARHMGRPDLEELS